MDDDLALFAVDQAPAPPAPKESQTVRRTRRQAALLAAGLHPLTSALSAPLRLHPEAAPYGDLRADGRRCGNCQFREQVHGGAKSYPKCLFGWDGNPRHDPPRATHGGGTDCRAWWSACTDHEWKEDHG